MRDGILMTGIMENLFQQEANEDGGSVNTFGIVRMAKSGNGLDDR